MQLSAVNLDNYSGLWCVEPIHFQQVVDCVNMLDLAAHIAAQEPQTFDGTKVLFTPIGGGSDRTSIAVVDVSGTMTKAGSSLGGGGTVRARRAIRQADRDPSIEAIIVKFDTPGGTVAGTSDLAAEIKNTTTPIIGYAEDLCASAGMWAASQCDELYANAATAKIGSIGAFMALHDVSKALENDGVKTIVVKAGEFKGGGFPGAEVSEEQIAEWQKLINATQAEFTQAIASGRGMSLQQAETLVTGLVYMAEDAIGLNLIDGIKSFDEVVSDLRNKNGKGSTMSSSTPATFQEIVAACPGVNLENAEDSKFITECLRAEMSVADATAQYCQTLRDRVAGLNEQVSALTQENANLKSMKPKGVPAVGTVEGPEQTSDPIADFNAAVRKEQEKGKTRAEAVRAVNSRQPELREAMVAACN